MKRCRIIYNPTAGRESFKSKLPDVLVKLEQAGFETSVHETTEKGNATKAATLAAERRFDTIVVAGGDGTINEVVTGLAESDYRPRVGIVPAGTTNDFARALHIPKSVDKAVDIIVAGQTKKLDIGKVNQHYFVNISGGGKLTEVSYEVPSKLKTMIGQLAYIIKGAELLPRLRPIHTRIEYDGELFEGEIMMFLVANTNSVGGFEKLAPDAEMDDGVFDLLVLKKANIAELLRAITAATRGAHFDDPNVLYVQAKSIRVETDEKMQLNIDGEYGGDLPGVFTNLKQHIEYYLPTDEQIKHVKADKEIDEALD